MEWDGVHAAKFVGIDNFVRMASDPNFKAAFWHTIEYVIGTVPTTIVCALALAILLNQKIFARNFFRTVSFFPYVASLVAVAAVWNMLFNPSMGPVNQLLASFGVENLPKWAAGNDTAMLTVIMFSVWKNMGYYMVIFLAGLQGTNPELYEAASLDGANKWQQFWNVTLPQLAPTTFFVTIMVVIQSFKVYNEVYMITQGGPGTSTLVLVYQIYNEAFIGTPGIRLLLRPVDGPVPARSGRHHHPVQSRRGQGRSRQEKARPESGIRGIRYGHNKKIFDLRQDHHLRTPALPCVSDARSVRVDAVRVRQVQQRRIQLPDEMDSG